MYKVTPGPTVYFDVDDTLVSWFIPKEFEGKLIEVECRGHINHVAMNTHNIDLLKKMASRGHAIVVWSGGGADWCEAVVKALQLEEYVEVVMGKPTYYIDDRSNPKEWIGKHGFFTMDGKRVHGDNLHDTEEEI